MKHLFLYLARRDKTAIKLLSTFKADKEYKPTPIKSLDQLSLPLALETRLNQEIETNKMLWEPMVESAENYKELKKALRKRGYKNLPINPLPNFNISREVVTNTERPVKIVKVYRGEKSNRPTMLRRKD